MGRTRHECCAQHPDLVELEVHVQPGVRVVILLLLGQGGPARRRAAATRATSSLPLKGVST